ncbi:M20/M25/M40 family metallo-hydrolase [Sphingosinicella sp. LHD-64]|uniref:M20/M25/M40 family metallo-hydrolase n=1 Tax=Sphingosinicella sp. LHD-64 TaxID=3072139 RepID=UPI00281046B6|nr:M20/M25/M40 family metallo-hydrolase [Sphingosinicella sp. LHD-64]MDQ8755104.1 M20/M25/M40 family metallo-hydrolase [Sphingosinicella sp. LHD-64]
MTDRRSSTDRRSLLKAAAASAALLAPGAGLAQTRRDGDREAIRRAVDAGFDESVQRLKDWIAHPTIAAEQLNIEQGADYMVRLATDAGFTAVRKVPTGGVPAVFGVLDAGARRTMGIYFMYDVKQYDASEWTSPPLEGQMFDHQLGRAIRGRGATNQKGPESAFLAAVHAFRAAGKRLPVNLVLLAEGEEEIGSPNFHNAFNDPEVLAAMRRAEGVIIPMNTQAANGAVSIALGSKGIVELELVSSGERWGRGPARDIHSSLKAQVDSPVWHLVEALKTLVTDHGNTPAIEGWFEHVRPLTDRERALIAESARTRSEEEVKRQLGVQRWIDDLPWRESLERLASQPTVNIEGLVAGYTGPGGKTVLPARAVAKLDLRLVPNMTREDCVAKLRAHLDRQGFNDIEVNVSGGYNPTETAEDSRVIRAQQAVFTRDNVPFALFPRMAGSWPGVTFTGDPLRKPAAQFGLGYGSGAHAPDEFMLIESNTPAVAGYREAAMGYVDFLYEMATIS